jgi:hypothetical protein
MSILNARANSFYFVFPKGFFPDKVHQKYIDYLKAQPTPYDTLTSYMNSTIQAITFPSMSIDSVEQVRNLGKKVNYQSATPVQDLFARDFQVTFRVAEGFINYFIMLETVLDYLDFKNPAIYVQNLPLRTLDNQGNIITTVMFKEVIFGSFSELNFNYTQNAPTVTTFSVGFRCNYIGLDLEIDRMK